MGLSGLNAHSKKYNFILYNECPKCGGRPEDEAHFLIKCPNYATQRAVLVGTITPLINKLNIPNLSHSPRVKADYAALSSLLLFRNTNLSLEDNVTLFNAVQSYISGTIRF